MRGLKIALHYFGASLWILSIFVFLFNGNPDVQILYKVIACVMFTVMAIAMIAKGHEKDTSKEGGILAPTRCEFCFRNDRGMNVVNGYTSKHNMCDVCKRGINR